MELYAAVRRSVYVEGLSERAAARHFGLARETVRKMLRYRRPPGYRRAQPIRRPKLDAFTGIIDQILREDQSRPKKQRHTAKRIGERLRAEHGFTGGDTIVNTYVRERRLGGQEMFVPLAHPPGDAQADFGEALVVIAGVECKAHYLVVDLPHSDDGFVKAFPAETTEAFCDGHNAAFRYFGGVPRRIVYDNTKLAVARILGDGTRQRTQVFSELQSHYLFDDRFGRPGKGNDKGKVEGLVGYARRNFFVPIPRFDSWDALNADLACQCRARRGRRLRRHTETIGERFTTAAALVNELLEARDDKRLLRVQKQLAKQDLLIVDELGYVPLSKTGAELLFEIFSQRYEQASTLVTSNLPFNADGRAARSADASRPHPGAERRELSPRTQQEKPASPRPLRHPEASPRDAAFRHSDPLPDGLVFLRHGGLVLLRP